MQELSSAGLLAPLFTLHLLLSRIRDIRPADWTDICYML